MVAYGYILPKKNIDLRLKNLELGLKNQELKNINSKLNLSLYSPLTISSNVPTITQQTGQAPQVIPQIPEQKNLEKLELYRDLSDLEKKRGSEIGSPKSAEERALLSAVEAKKREKKGDLSEEEISDIASNISKTKSLLSEISTGSKATASTTAETIAELEQELREKYKDVGLSENQIQKELRKVKTNKLKELLIKEVNSGKPVYYANSPNQKLVNEKYILKTDGNNLFKIDGKELPVNSIQKTIEFAMMPRLTASEFVGLPGGEVKSPYYSSYKPNFGNLHLMEHSLKRNQLTIYRPYSKITMVSKTNISPLLKKMILDIQNTLEFDERDYQNLEGDEKRVIERIIRSQKDMKNYNIKALIDEDDAKIKKRLEILVGQINAGNASSLVKQEMKALLKKLYDNKAISLAKYTTSLKSIKALG